MRYDNFKLKKRGSRKPNRVGDQDNLKKMKKSNLILIVIICVLFISGSYGQELKTEKIAEVNILTDAPTAAGSKIIYPIQGGTIKGKINGTFLPIGADFGSQISPTNFKIDVRQVIQTDDNATIYVAYTGYIYADLETFNLIDSGRAKEVSPDKYYFRISPTFETTSPKYDWLNHTVAIGIGTVTETGVSYTIYAVK